MKKGFVMNQDRIFSIVTILFSIFMFVETGKIKATFTNVGGSDPGSKVFPYAIAVLLFICGIGKFIRSNKPDEKPFMGGKVSFLRSMACIAVLGIYVVLLKLVGFLIGTVAASAALVLIMAKGKKLDWWRVALFSVGLTAVLYVGFQVVLKIQLPAGMLFS